MRQWHFHHPFWGSALVMGGARLIGSMFGFGWKLRHDVDGSGLSDGDLNAKLAHVLEAVELGLQKGGE